MLIARGEPRLYSLMTWLFVYIFLGLAPIVQIRTSHYPETTPGMLLDLQGTAAIVIVVGVLGLALGESLRLRPVVHSAGMPELNEPLVKGMNIVSLAATWWYIGKVESALFATRDQYSLLRSELWPNPTAQSIAWALGSTPLLVCTACSVVFYRRNRSLGWLLVVAVQVASLLIVVNPISSPRIAFGTVLLSLLGMFGAFATSRRIRVSAVAMILGMVLVFPYADVFRNKEASVSATLDKGNPLEAMTRGDFDAYAQITNTVAYVEGHGTTTGRQALGVAFFWIPRSVWPDKAIDTGVLLAQERGYRFKNLSAPLWAELYINGSWGMLLVGMPLVGWVLRRQDDARTTSTRIGIAGSVLPFQMLIILRGSLLQAIAVVMLVMACSALVTVRGSRERFGGYRDDSSAGPGGPLPLRTADVVGPGPERRADPYRGSLPVRQQE